MDRKMKTLLFILLVFKSFPKITPRSVNSPNYDISETLRNSIQSLFQNVEKNTTEKIMQFREITHFNSTYNLKQGNKIFLFNMTESGNYILARPTIYFNFITNEMLIIIPRYARYESGILTSLHNLQHFGTIAYFSPTLHNVRIGMSQSPKNSLNKTLWIELPSGFEINHSDVHFYEGSPEPMNSDEKSILKNLLESLLLQHMYDKLVEFGKHISSNLRQNTRTILKSHPNFFNEPENFFYLIPNITCKCFNLTNIIIKGLTNFVSINKTDEGAILLIKNIRGEMILDYWTEIAKSMELIFSADELLIRANLNNGRSNVEMRNYRPIRTSSNFSLNHHQSVMIISYIEFAIASSLMPSMKTTEIIYETSIQTDCESILNELNPFNEDLTTPNAINLNPTTCKNQINRPKYEYHITFENLTIKLISGNSDPKEIQCEFPDNLKIVQKITATPVRRRHWNNKGDGIDLKFHANFTSISFSHIKPNTSSPNDTCEFQLNNERTKVKLVPEKTSDNNTDLMLKKEIDKTLISMAKEQFVRNIKPVICAPFEICSQAVKMADNFVLQFIDKILKKCSLRRNQTNS